MQRQVASVVLNKLGRLDMEAVAAALRRRHPDVPVKLMAGGGAAAPIIQCAGETIVVLALPMPVPKRAWELPVRRAEATWRQGARVFAEHSGHMAVSTAGNPEDRLASARSIAAVAGALIDVMPGCTGVLWDSAVAHAADRWRDMAASAFAPYPGLPFPLWVSIHPFQDGQKAGAVTFGLSSFIGREIEFEATGQDAKSIVQKVAGLAVYLMDRGDVLKDGDTFGATDAERVTVRHTVSKRVAGLPVLFAA